MIKEKDKVVCVQTTIGSTVTCSPDGPEIEEGMMFVYRGESPPGLHVFGPDYDQGHNVGFQVDTEEFENVHFRNNFKPIGEW